MSPLDQQVATIDGDHHAHGRGVFAGLGTLFRRPVTQQPVGRLVGFLGFVALAPLLEHLAQVVPAGAMGDGVLHVRWLLPRHGGAKGNAAIEALTRFDALVQMLKRGRLAGHRHG